MGADTKIFVYNDKIVCLIHTMKKGSLAASSNSILM